MRRHLLIALPSAFLLACAPPSALPTPAPDRVLAVDSDGNVIRRSTGDEKARAEFKAPVDRVWPALVMSYAELGIEPTVADRGAGQYGNGGFLAPKRLAGRPLATYFDCGSGLTGPYIDAGRLIANVVTYMQPGAEGKTTAVTYATGTLRRNDGASADPIVCASTGMLEEEIRKGVEKHLAGRS
jgi:hypothetical protein